MRPRGFSSWRFWWCWPWFFGGLAPGEALGGRAAREQAFVGQVAALWGGRARRRLPGYLPSSVVVSGGTLELRGGGQVLERLPLLPSLSVRASSGEQVVVEYYPGGKLRLGGEVDVQGRTGRWRLLVGEAGLVRVEAVR